MKSALRQFVSLCILLMLFSCMKIKDLYLPPVEFKISISNLSLTSSDEEQFFSIESNYDWSITSSDPKCVIRPNSAKKNISTPVSVSMPENIGEDKYFVLRIKAADEVREINVRQAGLNYAKTSNDIIIDKFGIEPAQNEGIYIPISFVSYASGQLQFNGIQEIRYYKADLTNLAAFWKANVKKVTVNNQVQENGISKQDYTKELVFRFYALDDSYQEFKVRLTNPTNSWSGLPILVLTTDDGKDITSKEIWRNGKFKLDPQGNDGVQVLQGVTELRGRGNSTWGMPKKPYALKLKDKASGAFMGMSAHKRWALLANYADKTSLRNRVAFELGKRLNMAWTPDTRFVDVILNGKFLGNYLLTEQIKIDKNRVNIEEIDNKEMNSTKISGGWLMEVDRFYSNGETRYFRPSISQLPIIVKDPEDANALQMEYIENYFNTFEPYIYPSFPKGVAYHTENADLAGVPDSAYYGQYIDINSFINYWIVQELTENRDSRLPGSVYMYKGVDKKVFIGPLWDFDLTTFLGGQSWLHYDYLPTATEYNEFGYRSVYYTQLFRDPKFKAKAKQRWQELYSQLINDIPKFIDKEYGRIAKSLELNWIEIGESELEGVWDLSSEDILTGGRNKDKNVRSSEAVSRLKSNYLKRVNWMNDAISKW